MMTEVPTAFEGLVIKEFPANVVGCCTEVLAQFVTVLAQFVTVLAQFVTVICCVVVTIIVSVTGEHTAVGATTTPASAKKTT